MKVTFVYTDCGLFNQNNFNRGVAILSACLKQKGYQVGLLKISKPITKKEFIRLIEKERPDLIAFSFISTMFTQIKKFSLWVKELGIPALHGGMHPTVAPEDCLAEEGINVICRGEGEGAIVDFCAAMEAKSDLKTIPNIWVKEEGRIYRNPCRALIENLDSLPYPDYELFEYDILEESLLHRALVTQASRGCLYSCTYCCNALVRSLYSNKEKFLRHYSVDRLLEEVEWGLKKYPFLKEVRFYDDTLAQDKDWFSEFALKYKNRIGLPYSGNERVENIDLETASRLKASGCVSLDLGIESGNSMIRERYMNRWMSNEKIIDGFSILKQYGIRANSFNVLGMVGETPQSILETVRLNALVNPLVVFNAYFYPFKGTRAYEMVQEKKYRIREGPSSFFEKPIVIIDTIQERQLVFFYKYFYFLMGLYARLWKVFKNEGNKIRAIDKIVTSRYFPYSIFNFFHFGKEDLLVLLRRHYKVYLFLRRLYRGIKR